MEINDPLVDYLNKLNANKLLTKREEIQLLRRIEDSQDKILSRCLQFGFFRNELASYLNSLPAKTNSEITVISRKLDNNASREECLVVKTEFKKLCRLLKADTNRDAIRKSLKGLSLTSTHIYTLISKIREKYALLSKYLDLQKRLFQYFEVSTEEELYTLCGQLREDPAFRKETARRFHTTTINLLVRVRELDDLDQLIKTLNKTGLDVNEFKELRSTFNAIERSQKDMEIARDELVVKNLRLVVSRAKRFVKSGMDLNDLIQEGNSGLVKAINRLDSSRGVRVSTYATWWIDQALRRAITNKVRLVRLPMHIEAQQVSIGTAKHALYHRLGRNPTNKEVAEEAGLKVKVVDTLAQTLTVQVNQEESTNEDLSILDLLEADSDPFEEVRISILRDKIKAVLGQLKPRTEKILRLRFGIGEPHDGLTLKELSDELGISRERVRAIQNEAIAQIRGFNGGLSHDD